MKQCWLCLRCVVSPLSFYYFAPHAPTLGLEAYCSETLEAVEAHAKNISFAKSAVSGLDQAVYDVAELGIHNAERNLQSWAKKQMWRQLLPDPFPFNINANKYDEPTETLQSALLPHEVFHTLYTHAPEVFGKVMLGGDGLLEQFWREAATINDDWFRSHPVISRVANPSLMVPLGIHGDDAGVQGQEQVLVITWGSVVHKQCTLDSRIVFTMLKVADIVPNDTMETIYNVLRWSFQALVDGEFPAADHLGQLFSKTHHPQRLKMVGKKLAGGMVGCWAELRGDWKWLKEALHLTHHYGLTDFICHRCNARKFSKDPGMRFTNFKRDASHRATCFTNSEWMAVYLAAAIVSPLILIPGWHVTRAIFDILHTFDLGVYQVAVPSAMKELTSQRDVWPGRTKARRFLMAHKEYRAWCRKHVVKSYVSKPFAAKSWLKHKYPNISQFQAKGAALRSMVYWIEHVCSQNISNEHDRLRAAMFKAFADADRVCRRAGRHFTPQEHLEFNANLEAALVSYNALAVEALNQKRVKHVWKLLPKHHAATHYYDIPINPRRVACNQDEDMVGRGKHL